ncbi:MAG: hypothetical protein B7Z73_03090, partial [Planctomycetia bacterium 21-64-5]
MSRRNRQRGGSQVAGVGPREEIERLLNKGRVKDAFKQAKLCFREDAGAENRLLLERIYLLRVKDLLRGGMPTAAAEVARHFVEFGVSEPPILSELITLLPQVGMMDEARRLAAALPDIAPEAQAALSVSLADRAVLHPEQTPPSMADVRQGAERIRQALAALDEQNEDRAVELLKDIARSSPWADWRVFVRGLAAFRRGDREQAFANWDRLDGERSAHRIAACLRATWTDSPTAEQGKSLSATDFSRLETAVFGEPVLSRLDRLRRLVDKTNPKGGWKRALGLLPALNGALRRVDRGLAQRLTEILLPLVIDEATDRDDEEARVFLDSFTKLAEPCPLDPHWSRMWALCWQLIEERDEALACWQKYARELDGATGLEAGERQRIQALVWWHVGMVTAAETRAGPLVMRPSHDKKLDDRRDRAVEALEESLRFDPQRRETHDSLITLYEEWEQPELAAEARRKLLAALPDDLEALKASADYDLRHDQPQQALDNVRRARKLKPLDAFLVEQERSALLGVARHEALAGRWDEGRSAFALAESLRPASSADYSVLARRALFELKAGEKPRAEALIEKAKGSLAEPAPVWLVLAIEAARYKLPAAKRGDFNRELQAALRKKKNGETAGRLAELVAAYRGVEIEYPEKAEHLRLVLDYLRGTSRTKYAERDLIEVCRLLEPMPDEQPLYEQMVRRGLKNFPKCPVFHVLSAEQELGRGPFGCNIRAARTRLQKALALAQADPEGKYGELVDAVKRHLAMLEWASALKLLAYMTIGIALFAPWGIAESGNWAALPL